jgi:hypothetical protein
MAGSRLLFGESLLALHIVPALAGAGTLVFACWIARELGGKTFAAGLTALGFLIAPVWLTFDSVFTYDCLDQLALAGFLFVLVRYLTTGNRRLWILLGALAGIACLTKMTLPLWGPGFVAALLLTNRRKDLLTPFPWLGAAVFLVVLFPYILWEAANHWVTVTYWHNYGSWRVYQAPLPEFLNNILFSLNPFLLPVYALGLYRAFRRRFAFLGVMFLVSLTVAYFLHVRTWMLAGLFLPLIAAGALHLEEILAKVKYTAAWKAAAATVLAAAGILVAPANLPIMPVADLSAYADNFQFLYRPIRDFIGEGTKYPGYFSLRFGWEDLVRDVAAVYNGLPAEERADAGIYATSYAHAAAVDMFGPAYGLPPAVSGNLTYYLWGPGTSSWEVMVVIASKTNEMAPFFERCEMKSAVTNEFTLQYHKMYIFICRNPKVPPQMIWSSVAEYL